MSPQRNGHPHELRVTRGGECIAVAMTYGPGDRLSISVHPDLRVTARAPQEKPAEEIAAHVRARAGWIVRQRRYFARLQPFPAPRRFVSGETHVYLGRQYRLRVRKGQTERVWMERGYIRVDLGDPGDSARLRVLLRAWYRTRARDVLTRRAATCAETARSLGLAVQVPVLREMRTRWGSCTKSGRILLNPDLVKAPVHCIDYVIMHELCHLKVMRHDRRFYALLDRVMPDWQRRKERLDRVALPDA